MPGLASTPSLRGYTVGKVIGTGAYSWVRIAKDTRRDRVVALKIFNTAQYRTETKFGEALKREVAIQKSLKHENIIALLDVVEESPWVCMALEMAAGGELFDKIAPDIGVEQDLAHLYFVQLIQGVEYLHSKGIVHRDLKPENLLLDEDGNLKISDFGMSAVFYYKGAERPLSSVQGSLPYIAPEVITMVPYAARPVDIWSCGIILYALLFGNTPWEAPSRESPEFSLYMERPDLDYEPWNMLDSTTKDLLRGTLSINVSSRYQMRTIKQHPWFTQPNPYLVNGRCNDPVNVATRLLSSMTVASEPSDEDTQPISQEDEEILSFSQPDVLRRIGQTDMAEHEPHMLFSQPVARVRNDGFASQSPRGYHSSTQAPSLTQVQRNFADICGIGKTNLTRFFSDADTAAEIVPRLCNALDGMLIANRPSTSASTDHNVDAYIVVKTTDRRKCPLEGDILITNARTRGGGRLALVAFEKRRGCPIEWKRLYRAICENIGDLIVQSEHVGRS